MLPALYLLCALAVAGALTALLLRPGVARPAVVWGLAALMPLLAAVAAALHGQARADRVLAGYAPQPTTITLTGPAGALTLTLSPQDAACVERALRLHTRSELRVGDVRVPLTLGTRVTGELPPARIVDALGLSGGLSCPNLRALLEETNSAAPGDTNSD